MKKILTIRYDNEEVLNKALEETKETVTLIEHSYIIEGDKYAQVEVQDILAAYQFGRWMTFEEYVMAS